MDCVNHSGVIAAAYCQNCGKALCSNCVRSAAAGQVLCEPCSRAWQTAQTPFVQAYSGGPNPAVAAVLGLIPGVGAMYNGQFLKGLVHLFIFAVLVSAAGHFSIFGFFVAGWIFYQVFEAYHVAKARRDGLPVPDPLGLNEIGSWLNSGARGPHAGAPGAGSAGYGNPSGPGQTPPSQTSPQAPYQAPYESPYKDKQAQWQTPYQGQDPAAGGVYPGPGASQPGLPPIPPIPPPPPYFWRRKEPVGAVILIALGVLLLLGQMDLFSGRVFEYGWPLMLIALGVWLIVRRLQDTQGGRK